MPVTKITPLPISSTKSSTATSGDVKVIEEEEEDPTFGGLLPKLSEKEIQFIADSLKADVGFYEREKSNRKKIQKRIMAWAMGDDLSTPWWMLRQGERPPPVSSGRRLKILWPEDRKLQRARTSHRGRHEIRL